MEAEARVTLQEAAALIPCSRWNACYEAVAALCFCCCAPRQRGPTCSTFMSPSLMLGSFGMGRQGAVPAMMLRGTWSTSSLAPSSGCRVTAAAMWMSAFGLLSGEQATVLAMQVDLYKVFTFAIKHYLQGSNYAHWLIFLQ